MRGFGEGELWSCVSGGVWAGDEGSWRVGEMEGDNVMSGGDESGKGGR